MCTITGTICQSEVPRRSVTTYQVLIKGSIRPFPRRSLRVVGGSHLAVLLDFLCRHAVPLIPGGHQFRGHLRLFLWGRHQGRQAQREAELVGLPRVPELAVRLGHLGQDAPLRHGGHPGEDPQPGADLVEVGVPQLLLLGTKRGEGQTLRLPTSNHEQVRTFQMLLRVCHSRNEVGR
jgi:hypothetical protein